MSYSKILSHMPDFNVITLVNYSNEPYLSFHNFSCSKTLLYRIFSKSNTLFSHQKLTNAKVSFVQTNSYASLKQNEITYPLDTCFDNLLYHPNLHNDSVINKNKKLLHDFCENFFKHNLHTTLTYYKILIYISLLITCS